MDIRKKVEIVIDAAAEGALRNLLDQLHVRGYTVVPNVRGKGDRGLRRGDDPFDVSGNILVLVVTNEETADRIVEATLGLLRSRAGIVLVSDVAVFRPGQF